MADAARTAPESAAPAAAQETADGKRRSRWAKIDTAAGDAEAPAAARSCWGSTAHIAEQPRAMVNCAARSAVLQDANLLAVVLGFLPARTTILARQAAHFWRETAKRPLVCAGLNEGALQRARTQSDAYVMFRKECGIAEDKEERAERAGQSSAVEWLIRSYENGICSAVFDELGGFRKHVIAAIKWFMAKGPTRLLIVAQPSALRDWAHMLQAAAVSCVTSYQAEDFKELCSRLQHDPAQMVPEVLLRTPLQVEAELQRLARAEGSVGSVVYHGHTSIFGARYWHYTVFDTAPMQWHESQQVALSHRFKTQQYRHTQPPPVYALLSASPPPKELHMLAPLLELPPAWDKEFVYSRLLEVVDCFCMGDADTRQWALEDYLPAEVASLLRPCLLHVHTSAAPS